MKIHTLKEKENIYTVAEEYGLSPLKIAEINGIMHNSELPEGRDLLILTPTKVYNVKKGDTLEKIAERFKADKNDIIALNPELRGKNKLYAGQLLYLKADRPLYGTASSNGYCYYGYKLERIITYLPYMNYLTVCAARSEKDKITALFDDRELIDLARNAGKIPLLRVYVSSLPSKDEEKAYFSSLIIFLKNHGYPGVTFSSLTEFDEKRSCEFVLNAKKHLLEEGITLAVECPEALKRSYCDYADLTILLYDKIHNSNIPTFDAGEKCYYEEYAEVYESAKTFLDISSFAYNGEKYIEKEYALDLCDKRHFKIQKDCDRLVSRAYKDNKEMLCFENLDNTKAKLELLSELGFLGISFDIMRMPIADIMMFYSMFGLIKSSAYFEESGKCRGGI